MTRTRAALTALGWSVRDLASVLAVKARTAERWVSGARDPPGDVLAWLERVVALIQPHRAAIREILAAHPPPASGSAQADTR